MKQPETIRPLVSVIIPAFNCQETISETLDSVFAQTYPNVEILVIDDGSTDDTPRRIHELAADRLRYIRIENSGGPARPRNVGIAEARGEFIAFLDSDDLWLPTKLEDQVNVFTADPRLSMVFVLYVQFAQDGDLPGTALPRDPKRFTGTGWRVFRELYLRAALPNSGMMVRRSTLLAAGGFNERPEAVAVEDSDLWLRICLGHEIGYVPKVLVRYRLSSTSLSRVPIGRFIRRMHYLQNAHRPVAGFWLYMYSMARLLAHWLRLYVVRSPWGQR